MFSYRVMPHTTNLTALPDLLATIPPAPPSRPPKSTCLPVLDASSDVDSDSSQTGY